MGKIIKKNLPCLSETCKSSDARQLYEDFTSFCFSCQTFFKANEEDKLNTSDNKQMTIPKPKETFKKILSKEEILELPTRNLPDRKISKAVSEFFNVKVSYNENGEVDAHYYPYENNKAFKVRRLPKTFSWINHSSDLFGKTCFNSGGKRLIIAEGEIDALSIAQCMFDKYEKIYPVVALSSSVMTNSILQNREWIRSFNEVVICFDEDDAGYEAQKEAIRIIGFDKAKIVKLPKNDANDVLKEFGSARLLQCLFDAAPYVPSGIIGKEKLWDALVAYNNTPSVPYPSCIGSLNKKVKGARLGEIALFVSGTSCGKSTVMREICLSMQDNTDSKIGIVSLEESPAETARKLAGMVLKRNPAEEEISLEELRPGFDKVFGSDRYMLLDHQGSLKDENIIDKLEYMALSGAKYIIIDHITILVSEGAGDLTGNEAIDKVMNDLLRFVKRHNVWIGLVSHLRKTTNTGKAFEEGRMPNLDDIKGSGSIKQISFDIIAFARNLQAEDPVERNTISLSVLKCRYTGLTGPVEGAYYDYKTGRFTSIENAPREEFVAL
jgi:twinkle protein